MNKITLEFEVDDDLLSDYSPSIHAWSLAILW